MIKISHEVPTSHIPFAQMYTDLDFAIAHFVLAYPEYAFAYCNRTPGRILILDNGKFELISPLPVSDILRAAELTKADYVVAPDYFGDTEKTTAAFLPFVQAVEGRFKIAAVSVGQTPGEIARCYEYYLAVGGVDMYCWSFLYDRAGALSRLTLDATRPHHLLGFGTLKEFSNTIHYFKRAGIAPSIDTMKPISATWSGKVLEDVGRGQYSRPQITDILDERRLAFNVGIFRGWLTGVLV